MDGQDAILDIQNEAIMNAQVPAKPVKIDSVPIVSHAPQRASNLSNIGNIQNDMANLTLQANQRQEKMMGQHQQPDNFFSGPSAIAQPAAIVQNDPVPTLQ